MRCQVAVQLTKMTVKRRGENSLLLIEKLEESQISGSPLFYLAHDIFFAFFSQQISNS
jgi:hypothetical protein